MAKFNEFFTQCAMRAQAELLKKDVTTFTKQDLEAYIQEQAFAHEALLAMMSTQPVSSGKRRGPRIPMAEALRSEDMSILFPKVISDVLLRPREPLMIGQTLLAKTVQVDNVRSIEFPSFGAIRAFDIPESGGYKEQLPAFTEHFSELKTTKVGLMVSISDVIVKDSMWDILALYIEAMGYAMIRKKEEKIFNEFTNHAHVVFDNSLSNTAAQTHGRALGAGGTLTPNFTVTFNDFIDLLGGIVANEYNPTDVLFHPLAWVIWMKDPIIRNIFYTGGQLGANVWTQTPQFDQQALLPWNINYQVTPFMPITFNSVIQGLAPTSVTNMYVVDRQNGAVVLERDEMEMDNFEDWHRDLTQVKTRERYAVGTLNEGRAYAAINNIRLEENQAPAFNIGQVVPS